MKTPNDGANEERSKWMRLVRKERRKEFVTTDTAEFCERLLEYGKKRTKRYKKSLGGLK